MGHQVLPVGRYVADVAPRGDDAVVAPNPFRYAAEVGFGVCVVHETVVGQVGAVCESWCDGLLCETAMLEWTLGICTIGTRYDW